MSRNQREGHYYGWAKGRHIRCNRAQRDKWKVTSWFAFRVFAVRRAGEWAQRVMAARAKQVATHEAEALGDKGKDKA